jgi:hypothetical protein
MYGGTSQAPILLDSCFFGKQNAREKREGRRPVGVPGEESGDGWEALT